MQTGKMVTGGKVSGGAASLRLAHLLATRLCHDISGPLGGLGAALGEIPNDPEALPLAAEAMLAVRRRLALVRFAWGDAPDALNRDDLRLLAKGLPNATRVQVELDGLTAGTEFPRGAARLVVNVLLLAAESLPGGGMLALAGNPATQVIVTIAGPRAAWPMGLGALFADQDAAWQAVAALELPDGLRLLSAPLSALLAHESGVRVSLLLARSPEQAPPLLLDFAGIQRGVATEG